MASGNAFAPHTGDPAMIRALFVTAITFAYILIFGPPMLLYAWITGNTDPVYNTGVLGARMALWLAGVEVEVKGREKILSGGRVVFMANHQGNCDPPAIFVHLPPVLILVKKEFFKVPVLGRAMRMRGFIPVDRKNREQAIQAVEKAVQALETNKPFLVFPEGTRSPDGRLQPFKKGVFVMAIKAGATIVPIAISGSARIMPKGRFVIRPGRVRVTFCEPVPTHGYTVEDRGTIMERVRQGILSALEPEERPLDTPA